MNRRPVQQVGAPEPLISAFVEAGGHRLPPEALHFGSLLLARKIIKSEQLENALELQGSSPYLRIGEILLGLGYISFAQLRSTLEDQYHDVRLGTLLLRQGLVSVDQLAAALSAQERTGARLGPVLISMGACTEGHIYQTLAGQESA